MTAPTDPVTTKIVWDRLIAIVNEASRVLYKSAFSTLVRECNDFACSLLTPTGETLAIADDALPSFATTQAYTLQSILETWPVTKLVPGDVLVTNDPWLATGQVMDITLLKPVFRQGRVVAFAGSVAHSPDLGGRQTWNGAVDVFEEGLQIPPMRLHQGGTPSEDLLTVIRANSRIPEQTLGDLHAQGAAVEIAERRVLELLDEYGLDDLDRIAEDILSRSERAMRGAIAAVPNGTYEHAFYADGFRERRHGRAATSAEPLCIRVAITVEDGSIRVDVSGSSPQVDAAINAVYPFTLAYAAYTLRLMLVPHVPQNGGSLRPIELVAPPGSIFNARRPAATLNRAISGHLVCDGIRGALSDVVPATVAAMSGSTPVWLLILVTTAQDGAKRQTIVPMNGGLGATTSTDGAVAGFPHNISNVSVETLEGTLPILWEQRELICDSAGAGEFRGGHGVRVTLRARERMEFALNFNRVYHEPQGFLGGTNGRRGRAVVGERRLEPDETGVLEAGQAIVIESPGGGGMGSPLRRSSGAVLADVDSGLLSAAVASRDYGMSVTAPSESDQPEKDD